MPAPLYTLRNLSRRFGKREVLCLDSLEIEAGEIYALLGPNGAGKSTLMRILSFLDAPTEGELLFRGEKVSKGQEARFRPGVVWVPQFPIMFTGTLLYNIEYPMALRKTPAAQRRRRALELLEQVNLAALAQAPANRLSGGEAQRAAVARALAAEAEVILFDEPTANVDQRSQDEFVALARQLWKDRKLSFLIATHNTDVAAALCRRQIFLKGGRLERRSLLPDGRIVWPGRLTLSPGAPRVDLPPEALDERTAQTWATLGSITLFPAGVALRLEFSPDRVLDVLLRDEASRQHARDLPLGTQLLAGLNGE